MKGKWTYCPVLLLSSLCCVAQLWAGENPFSDQLDQVNKLVKTHHYQAALQKADSILAAGQLEPEEKGAILLLKGKTHIANQKPVQAIGCYNQTLDLQLPNLSLVRGNAFAGLAELYDGEKSFELARSNYLLALGIYQKLDYRAGEADILVKMGMLDKRLGNTAAGVDQLQQAHAIYDEIGNPLQQAYAAETIGLMQFDKGELEEAEFYLLDAITIYDSTDFLISQDYLISYLAEIYNTKGDFGNAILYTEKAIQSNAIFNDSAKVSLHYHQLAIFQKSDKQLRAAIKSEKQALEWTKKSNREQVADFTLALAKLYAKSGRDTDAILAFYDAYAEAKSIHNIDKMIASSRATSDYFLSRSKADEAMVYAAQTDSLNQHKIAQLNSKYNNLYYAQKGKGEIAADDTPAIAEGFWVKNDKLFLNILICAIAILLVALLYYFRRNTQNRRLSKVLEWKVYKRTRDLQKANKELNTYIYKSSHDLRTPLTSIKSLLRLLATEQHSQSTNKYLGLISGCTDQMDDILIKLSRAVDYKNVDVKVTEVDFNHIQYELENKEISDLKGVNLIWNINQDAPFFSDINLIKVILKKTIDNSIDYRLGKEGDYCKINISTDRNGAMVTIEDNGVGISEKVRDTVFDMFVKGTHRSKGAGLGLYLVKIATERIQGKIQLMSEEKKGSKITFLLPNLS